MTAGGYARLQEELKRLKAVERPRIMRALEEARAHGDLSENAEYEAAKHEQGLSEGRIVELETKLRNAQVIDVTKLSGTDVKFGATVHVIDTDNDGRVRATIALPAALEVYEIGRDYVLGRYIDADAAVPEVRLYRLMR